MDRANTFRRPMPIILAIVAVIGWISALYEVGVSTKLDARLDAQT